MITDGPTPSRPLLVWDFLDLSDGGVEDADKDSGNVRCDTENSRRDNCSDSRDYNDSVENLHLEASSRA